MAHPLTGVQEESNSTYAKKDICSLFPGAKRLIDGAGAAGSYNMQKKQQKIFII